MNVHHVPEAEVNLGILNGSYREAELQFQTGYFDFVPNVAHHSNVPNIPLVPMFTPDKVRHTSLYDQFI